MPTRRALVIRVRFSDKRFFAHDHELLTERSFEALMSLAKDPQHKIAAKTLRNSGLEDFPMLVRMADEYYERCATLRWLEMDRSDMDPLYKQTSGQEKVARRISLRCRVQHGDKRFRYGGGQGKMPGQSAELEAKFHVSLLAMYREDFFPQVGDLVVFNGQRFLLTNVFFPASGMAPAINMPLHVTCDAVVRRDGGPAAGVGKSDVRL